MPKRKVEEAVEVEPTEKHVKLTAAVAVVCFMQSIVNHSNLLVALISTPQFKQALETVLKNGELNHLSFPPSRYGK